MHGDTGSPQGSVGEIGHYSRWSLVVSRWFTGSGN
jgi:hypothetical protein